jgi:repressor LexA
LNNRTTNTMPLTPRQTEILSFVERHSADVGYPPTRAEIAKHFKFRSVNAAEEHLRAIERHGYIEIARGTARGIRVLRRPEVDRLVRHWK